MAGENKNQGPIQCPHCEIDLNDHPGGVFCLHCGGELGSIAGGQAEQPQPPGRDPDPTTSTDIISPVPGAVEPEASRREREKKRRRVSKCKDLDVQYNVSRIFVDGVVMSFDFQITPLKDGLTDLCVEVRVRDQQRNKDCHVRECVPEIPEKDEVLDACINFLSPPGMKGRISFSLYISYRLDEETRWFVAHPKHWVFPAREKAQVVFDKLSIDLSTTIQQGHASDIQVQQRQHRLDDLTDAFVHDDDTAEKLTTIDLPEVWELLPLNRCKPPADGRDGRVSGPSKLPGPAEPARRRRLTLELAGHQLHFITGQRVQLGRKRGNDIIVRTGRELAGESSESRISRCHCRIEQKGGQVFVTDKASEGSGHPERASSWGIFVDGERVDPGRSFALQQGKAALLVLGGDDSTDPHTVGFEARVVAIDPAERVAAELPAVSDSAGADGLLLRRLDNVPESYAIVWGCLPVKLFDPHWGEGWMIRDRDAFAWQNGASRTWLMEGEELQLGNGVGTVHEFSQWGL